jgi:DNA-binding NarL/FixJ family response regulator
LKVVNPPSPVEGSLASVQHPPDCGEDELLLDWWIIGAQMKVLIVDDSAVVRRSVRTLFESDPSFEVCGEAENGREAIERVGELHPELVIMDLSMPVLNGLDATRGIRRIKPQVPVILFSGFSDLLKEEEAYSVGISALVPKSHPSTLIDVAHSLLRGSAA